MEIGNKTWQTNKFHQFLFLYLFAAFYNITNPKTYILRVF